MWEGLVAAPADLDMLHRSFARSLRAENRAPRTVETYTLAMEQFAAYLQQREDAPPRTAQLERRHVEDFLTHLIAKGTPVRQ